MSASEIFALRKQKRLAEALAMARAEYPDNASDLWLLRAYGWVLYDHAKELVEAYEQKRLSPAAVSGKLTPWMREFAKMAAPLRGDSVFSQMVRLAGKVSKDWPEFLGFARWAGVDHFSDDDKAPFTNEQGKTIDSLQKRFTRAICREAASNVALPQVDASLIDWALGILTQALDDDPGDPLLNYYQSKVHLARAEIDLAIRRLTPVLHRQSKAVWPWSLLGEILEVTRPDDSLTCYAHASQLAREEQEVAKVRIHLARRLSLAGRFDEAAHQASLALKYREQHGFKVPQELAQLLSSDWYQQAVADHRLKKLPDMRGAAHALLKALDRQNLRYTQGVIDHVNAERALSYVLTSIDSGFALLHRNFPGVVALTPGTIVEVGRATPEGQPLDWRLSDAQSLPGLCETVSGMLERRVEKDHATVQSPKGEIFVPPALASGFEQGRRYDVSCLAIRRTNKQGKTGWRAVSVNEREGRSLVLQMDASAI